MFDKLTKKEYEVMRQIWENDDGVSFSEICTYANLGGKSLSPQTINTHLSHLAEKGFIRVEQLFDGSLKKFVSALTLNGTLMERETHELKALIKRKGE